MSSGFRFTFPLHRCWVCVVMPRSWRWKAPFDAWPRCRCHAVSNGHDVTGFSMESGRGGECISEYQRYRFWGGFFCVAFKSCSQIFFKVSFLIFSGTCLLIFIALFWPYFVMTLSWCRCAILICLPGMPDVSARSLGLQRTWNRLFTKWIVSDLSHLQCCSTVSRRTSLMLSLHESFGYTFGKMTSYSIGITWAVWVICLAPGWILRLSHGISYWVWPQVVYVFYYSSTTECSDCLRFPNHFCSNASDHWSFLSCYGIAEIFNCLGTGVVSLHRPPFLVAWLDAILKPIAVHTEEVVAGAVGPWHPTVCIMLCWSVVKIG